jgi:alpha-ketoglutarate-dependent 2,4-dichlorophenoxyacetate dioxygenase
MAPITLTPLSPCFGAQVDRADITRLLDEATFEDIREAFEEHSVLVFRDQPVDDEQQVAFSRRFGPLEMTIGANPAGGSYFARQSNLDLATGEVIKPDDRRMIYQLANQLWHSDSSFKPVPALCSLLSARLVPPEGGATEFASARAAYGALGDDVKDRLEGLYAEHDFAHSRDQVAPGILTAKERTEVPPVRHPLIRTNPVNGRKALFIGAHASHIIGWPQEGGRKFLGELLEHATQPQFRYRHEWREGDLVVWDNRCVLHRATPYDSARHRRLMQRTTVAGDPKELACTGD